MTPRVLYPAHPLHSARADDFYAEEREAAQAAGLGTGLFSLENFQANHLQVGHLQVKPQLEVDETVIYRGWMLRLEEYQRLESELASNGARLLTSSEQYRLTHHLPQWYASLEEFTPSTRFFPDAQAALEALAPIWAGLMTGPVFVKDWVKSLSSGPGPVAHTPEDLLEIAFQMQRLRGFIEGGLCVRSFESFVPNSEERYFVAAGRVFARAGEIPYPVQMAAERISSPFFSVDVAQREDGVLRIVELGDGGVSDLKEWSLEQFTPVLEHLRHSV